MPEALLRSTLQLPGRREGKVRDVYELPGERLLIVATDRISAFDVVMPTPIAGKGALLTELSTFWLRFIQARGICRTHLLSTDANEIPAQAFQNGTTTREQLVGRVTLARKARVVPIECVVRGYLEGSGWREYQETGSICGVALPKGLRRCDRLPTPIFTPATKEEQGRHDENITFEKACGIVGETTMRTLRDLSLKIYTAAAEHALTRGVIIADTKFEFGFEFGFENGPHASSAAPMLIDEALTPDSSRFWPAEGYAPGAPQPSFDKQFLREYLESLVSAGRWNKQAPGPELPARIVESTLAKYREARDRLVRA
jgi:phosphoribosylaminoimidazole-succinocarboxamide synthase